MVSIIIPVYNTEEYLPKCLESAINQSFQDIEIIVVDDCSLGNCKEIVESYQKKDNRIVYLKNDINRGTYHTRENGTKHAQGEYILYVDSDDSADIDLLRNTHKTLLENPDLILYDTISVKASGEEKAIWTNKGNKNYSHNELFLSFCDRSFTSWATCGKILKRSLAIDVYKKLDIKDRLTTGEDLLFFFIYAYFCDKTIYAPYKGYYYNLTNESINRLEYTLLRTENHIKNLKLIIDRIKLFCQDHDIPSRNIDFLLEEVAQGYLMKFAELSPKDREFIFPELIETFGAKILTQYIAEQASFKEDKIRFNSDKMVQKCFPRESKSYQALRKFLMLFIKR